MPNSFSISLSLALQQKPLYICFSSIKPESLLLLHQVHFLKMSQWFLVSLCCCFLRRYYSSDLFFLCLHYDTLYLYTTSSTNSFVFVMTFLFAVLRYTGLINCSPLLWNFPFSDFLIFLFLRSPDHVLPRLNSWCLAPFCVLLHEFINFVNCSDINFCKLL